MPPKPLLLQKPKEKKMLSQNVFTSDDDDSDVDTGDERIPVKLGSIMVADSRDDPHALQTVSHDQLVQIEAGSKQGVMFAESREWAKSIQALKQTLQILQRNPRSIDMLTLKPNPARFKATLHEQIAQIYLILADELEERDQKTNETRLGPEHEELQESHMDLSDKQNRDYRFDALLEAEEAVRTDPTFPWAYFTLARSRILCGHGKLALESIDESVRLLKGSLNSASSNIQTRDVEEAISEQTRINDAVKKHLTAHEQQIRELVSAIKAAQHSEVSNDFVSNARKRFEEALRFAVQSCVDPSRCSSETCASIRQKVALEADASENMQIMEEYKNVSAKDLSCIINAEADRRRFANSLVSMHSLEDFAIAENGILSTGAVPTDAEESISDSNDTDAQNIESDSHRGIFDYDHDLESDKLEALDFDLYDDGKNEHVHLKRPRPYNGDRSQER